jgi:hypothetical protein
MCDNKVLYERHCSSSGSVVKIVEVCLVGNFARILHSYENEQCYVRLMVPLELYE